MNSNAHWSWTRNGIQTLNSCSSFPLFNLLCFREKGLTFQILLTHQLRWFGFRWLYRRARCTQRGQTCSCCPPWRGLWSIPHLGTEHSFPQLPRVLVTEHSQLSLPLEIALTSAEESYLTLIIQRNLHPMAGWRGVVRSLFQFRTTLLCFVCSRLSPLVSVAQPHFSFCPALTSDNPSSTPQ